jgi:hypothetical protein
MSQTVPNGNLVDCPNCHGEGVTVAPGIEHNTMSGMSVENPHAADVNDCNWCDSTGKVTPERAQEWSDYFE